MPHIQAGDIRLYYEIHGSGPPLFLVGGYTQHCLAWQHYFEPLSKHFQVIAFDNRGSGQSDAPNEPYSILMFAEDTVALMEALEIKSAHFLGQSMGTAIIQKLCLLHPDKVKKAILAAPFAHLPPISRHKAQTMLELLQDGVDQKKLIKLNASWMLSNRFIEDPSNVEQFIQMFLHDPYPQSPEGILGQADALFACDLRKDLSNIPHELLLLVGEHDIVTPPYCAKEIAENVQRAQVHTFKGMGHMFPWEIPEKVTKKVVEFLSQTL